MRFTLPTVALLALAVGCESVSSGDVFTSGMWADIDVTATGDGKSAVAAVLRVGGASSNTYVDLEGDDVLTVSVGEITDELNKFALGDYHRYQTTVDTDDPADPFTVAFTRTLDDGAPNTVINLPEPFDIGDAGTDWSPSTSLHVEWSPSGSSDDMSVAVDGECVIQFVQDVSGDPGAVDLEGADLEAAGDGTGCTLDVALLRRKGGAIDPGYGEGGTAQGYQIRSVEVTWSNP